MKNPALRRAARLAVALLLVPASSPSQECEIIAQPRSQSLCEGEPVVLSVEIEGEATGFQWRKDGVPLVGQHERVLKQYFENGDTPTQEQFLVPGDYDCVVDCVGGPVFSSVAKIRPASQQFGPWSVLHPYVQSYEWPPDGSLVVPGSDPAGAGEALLLLGGAQRCALTLADPTRAELASSQAWIIDSALNYTDDRDLIGLRIERNVGVNEVLPFAVLHAARASFYDSSSAEPVTVEWLQGGAVVATATCDYSERATWTTSAPQRVGFDWSDPSACAAQINLGNPAQAITVGGETHVANGIRFKRGTPLQQAAVAQLASGKHAINTKGTGAQNGRVPSSSARHAINTKGTGTSGRCIQLNYTAGGAGSPPDLRFSACTASYLDIDDDCDDIDRFAGGDVDEDCDLVISHQAPQPGVPSPPDITYTVVRRPLAAIVNFCPTSGIHARSAGFSWGATQMGSGGIKRCTLSASGVIDGVPGQSLGTLTCLQESPSSTRLTCDLDSQDDPVIVQLLSSGVPVAQETTAVATLMRDWIPADSKTHYVCGQTDHFRVIFPEQVTCRIEHSGDPHEYVCDEVRFIRESAVPRDRAVSDLDCELEGIDAFTVQGTFSDGSTRDITADCMHAACAYGDAVVYCPPSSGARMAINEKGVPVKSTKKKTQAHSRLSALLGQPGQLGDFPDDLQLPRVGRRVVARMGNPLLNELRIASLTPGAAAQAVFGLPDCPEGRLTFRLDATSPPGQVNTGSMCEIVTHAVVGVTGQPTPVGEAATGTYRVLCGPPGPDEEFTVDLSCDHSAIQASSHVLHLMNGDGVVLLSVPDATARTYAGKVFKTGHVTLMKRSMGPSQRCAFVFDSPVPVHVVTAGGGESPVPLDCSRIEFEATPDAMYAVGSTTGFSVAYTGGGAFCCLTCRAVKPSAGDLGQVTGNGDTLGVIETRAADGCRDDIGIGTIIEGDSGGFEVDLGESERFSFGVSPTSIPSLAGTGLSFAALGRKGGHLSSIGRDPLAELRLLPPSSASPSSVCTVECDFSDLASTELDVDFHHGADVTTARQPTAVIGFACTAGPSSVAMSFKTGHVSLLKQRTAMECAFPTTCLVTLAGATHLCDRIVVRPVNDPPLVDYAAHCVVTATGMEEIECPWVEVSACPPRIQLLGMGGNLLVARSSLTSQLFMSQDLLYWAPVVSPPSDYDPLRGDQAWITPNPAVDAVGSPAPRAFFAAQDDWRRAFDGQ